GAFIAVPVTALISLAAAAYINISNQTATAISVARDHGTELKLLREDYTTLRGELHLILQQLASRTDDRFRGTDAERMEERLTERIRSVEQRVEVHKH
ncbi:MAG: hypothetical protein ACYTG5_21565, partial [Planctomycetota bacterium]